MKVGLIPFYCFISGLAVSPHFLLELPRGLFAAREFDNYLSSLRTTVHSPTKRGEYLFYSVFTVVEFHSEAGEFQYFLASQ